MRTWHVVPGAAPEYPTCVFLVHAAPLFKKEVSIMFLALVNNLIDPSDFIGLARGPDSPPTMAQ